MADKRLPQIKTSVLVTDLIASLARIRDAELKENKLEHLAYLAARAKHVKAVQAHLRAKASTLTPDLVPYSSKWKRRSDVADWIVDGLPEEPAAPSDPKCISSKYDTLIAQLKLTTEPKVRLSPEDFRKFMSGDASACEC